MTRLGALTLRNRTAPQGKPKLREIWSNRVDEATEVTTKGQLVMRLARYVFSTAAAENHTFRWFIKVKKNSTFDQIVQFMANPPPPLLCLSLHAKVEACTIVQDWVTKQVKKLRKI